MMKFGLGCFVAALLIVAVSSAVPHLPRPRYLECLDSTECTVDHCCVLGMAKFSVPHCNLLGVIGSPCRPGAHPRNATLSYPDGQTVFYNEVHTMLCPCAPGLHCSHISAMCTDNDDFTNNHLDNDYNEV